MLWDCEMSIACVRAQRLLCVRSCSKHTHPVELQLPCRCISGDAVAPTCSSSVAKKRPMQERGPTVEKDNEV